MKQSGVFIPATSVSSHCEADRLLSKAGYVQETSDGMYAFFPLAGKVLDNIKQMIRGEMEKAGVLEVDLPYVQLEQTAGNSDEMTLLSFIEKEIISSNQFPISVFHIKQHVRSKVSEEGTAGLLNAKEYSLMSGYSFHSNIEDAKEYELLLHNVFSKIFNKIGISFIILENDTDVNASEYEFIAFTECGNETIALSENATYVSRAEYADSYTAQKNETIKAKEAKKIQGEGRTLEEIASSLNIDSSNTLYSYLYSIGNEPTLVLLRGDQELNELKLKKSYNGSHMYKMSDEQVSEFLGITSQHLGPVQLPFGLRVIADNSVTSVVNGLCGASEADTFIQNVNVDRDFAVDEYMDLRIVKEGDLSPDEDGLLKFRKAVTFARIVKPKPVFSKISVSDSEMIEISTGYYYIDLTRLFTVAADYFSDSLGLKWPIALAPYDVHLLIEDINQPDQLQLAEELNSVMKGYRFRVLCDERNVSGASKQQTSDLLGVPVKITVGNEASEGFVQVTYRTTGDSQTWRKEEVTEKLQEFFREE